MTKRATEWWLSAWDEYGESFDTGRIVQITAGVLAPENDPAVAVSVAGETPIKLAPEVVARFQECLGWAVAEHRMLTLRADERSDSSDADTAVLDQGQWQSVVDALQSSPEARPEALDALKASAPSGWLHNITEDRNVTAGQQTQNSSRAQGSAS